MVPGDNPPLHTGSIQCSWQVYEQVGDRGREFLRDMLCTQKSKVVVEHRVWVGRWGHILARGSWQVRL